MIKSVKRLINSLDKPVLEYLELHLTDHCNLNCKGCGHFSPIAPKHFASLYQYNKDMLRLKQLFKNILMIRLMGGEPLLHPGVESFMIITREAFPKSDIRLVTNGLLLKNVSSRFYEICRNTNTIIDLTIYPPFRKHYKDCLAVLSAENVSFSTLQIDKFFKGLNIKGNSDKNIAFNFCRSKWYCPFLQDGHIYHCAVPGLVHYFNSTFRQKIIADEGINIYAPNISGHSILKRLNDPIETCRYCLGSHIYFSWETSNQFIEEWVVNAESKKDEDPTTL